MGLDMYLSRRTYVQRWDHQRDEYKYSVTVTRGGKPVTNIRSENITYITERVGYWRKANQIHSWFVKNVQDDKDDCDEYHVSLEQLQELLDAVNKVLESIELTSCPIEDGQTIDCATGKWTSNIVDGEIVVDTAVCEELLPAASGFFFGSTEYNSWYVEDLKDTKKILEDCLSWDNSEWPDYLYQASW